MLRIFKSIIKKFLPKFFLKYYKLIYYFIIQQKFKNLNNKEIFSIIYSKNMWGNLNNKQKFYSGFGSSNSEIIEGFILNVNEFINNLNYKPTVLDIGCGDFAIGKKIFLNTKQYIACDVVTELIEYNKKKYKYSNLKFLDIDASDDNGLPKADVIILRQVLQHLSNQKIQLILDKIQNNYKYLIICEHLPLGDFVSNLDIKTGDLSRIFLESGVNIEEKPFYFKFTRKKILNEVVEKEGKLITIIYKK